MRMAGPVRIESKRFPTTATATASDHAVEIENSFKRNSMEFLECIKVYATRPATTVVNSEIKKAESISWNERIQTVRRTIVDQLSRLKMEEMCLRNLALQNEPGKRSQPSNAAPLPLSTTTNNPELSPLDSQAKRFCSQPSNSFDLETINQTELDLD